MFLYLWGCRVWGVVVSSFAYLFILDVGVRCCFGGALNYLVVFGLNGLKTVGGSGLAIK